MLLLFLLLDNTFVRYAAMTTAVEAAAMTKTTTATATTIDNDAHSVQCKVDISPWRCDNDRLEAVIRRPSLNFGSRLDDESSNEA